jgi:hypothetical protein
VILEKGSPRLGGWPPLSDHVFGDRGLRHFDSNLQQFPMNARGSPARVSEAHLPNQFADFRRYRRATFATPTPPAPIKPKSLAIPGDDRRRLDDEQSRPPIAPQLRKPDQEDSVSPTETGLLSAARTLQDQELMTKSKNLCLQSCATSEPISQTGEGSQHGLKRLHVVALQMQWFQRVRVSCRDRVPIGV